VLSGERMKYNIGDVIKIKLHKEIKYIYIINQEVIIGSPAYKYIIQGIENKTYWDSERDLEARILRAVVEMLEQQVKEIE
jgi:hypothetical protein